MRSSVRSLTDCAHVHTSETDFREKKMSEKLFLNCLCQLFLPGCIFSKTGLCPQLLLSLPSKTNIDLGICINQYTANSSALSTVPWLH